MAVLMGAFFLVTPSVARALDPDELLVIANKNASSSLGLARYYMEQRKIPKDNLLTVWITDKEVCTREAYLKKVAVPVRRYLESDKGRKIRCLLTMYGMPLKISSPGSREEKKGEYKKENDKRAALDSELTLVRRRSYPLGFWLANPFYYPLRDAELPLKKNDVTMVCRLDAPDAETVKRMINDSIHAEKYGLAGNAYFDARWPEPGDDKKLSGYARNDKLIHRAARSVRETKVAGVILDDGGRLFQPGDCPDAALYCGWYSLADYVDAFTWSRGAVGFHVASAECTTLKMQGSNVWCKRMLEKGIAATVGPVGEPYVQSFPNPEIFFSLLCDGYLTLVESYYVSLPFVSWKMVLLGDPLYRPYKKFRK
ncbi:MAG: TIGR03790 family protein [Desulfobacteraceae bacterium]|nr:TIGR03790 family protein [Desulfobacteraceae bacterium]